MRDRITKDNEESNGEIKDVDATGITNDTKESVDDQTANGPDQHRSPFAQPTVQSSGDIGKGGDGAAQSADGGGCSFPVIATEQTRVVSDYPPPMAATRCPVFYYVAEDPLADKFIRMAQCLQAAGDLYRLSRYGAGLLLASSSPLIEPRPITKASDFDPILADRMVVVYIKDDKHKGSHIPAAELNTMLHSENFLSGFRPVDLVVKQPLFLGDQFVRTKPGYNDHGRGQRVIYVGNELPEVKCLDATNRFLDVMEFASNADRTNAVAAKLTASLRMYWPGAKPTPLITSTKSHGGKETLVTFIAGLTQKVSISYEQADWALERAFVRAVKSNPEVGIINIENVRLPDKSRQIASAFVERFLTDSEPWLDTHKTGPAISQPNNWIVTFTFNHANLSDDMLNRGLPVHLTPKGDVAARNSPIGNPRWEYLPANRDRLAAEDHYMIERWKKEGMPLDTSIKHPCNAWAGVVGGILLVNGFKDFLGNYGVQKSVAEPVRKALGQLGACRPGEWYTASEWLPLVAHLGLIGALIPKADQESHESRRSVLGRVFSGHVDETLVGETDDEVLTLRLKKSRQRMGKPESKTRYRFVVLERQQIPDDDPC